MFLNLLSAFVGTTELPDGEGGTYTGYIYDDVWTSFAKDALANVFLWLIVAAAVIVLAVGIFVRFKKADFFRTYVKYAITFAAGLAVTVLVTMLSLEFFDMSENGYVFDLVLWPSIATGIVIVLGTACTYVCSLFSQKAFKIAIITSLSAFAAAVIALIVCLSIYFSTTTSGDYPINNLGLFLSVAGLIIAIGVLAFVLGRNEKKGFDSRTLAYAAVCIAMSFALSYVKIFSLPQGGSVTIASLLPLMIFSYMFGVKKGVFAGMIYGILQAIQDPWLIHPAQFLLDYPVAFAAIGLAGMFRNVKAFENKPQIAFALGGIVASLLRFISHVFSGVFAFGMSTDSGYSNVWIYSMAYNSFVFVDIAIVIVIGIFVFSSKSFMTVVNRVRNQTAGSSSVNEVDSKVSDNTTEN